MVAEQTLVDKSGLITVRDFLPGDRSFILATWLRGLRFGNNWFRLIDPPIYFRVYHQVIENLLSKASTTVKVACLKDDAEVILGYSVATADTMHFVFVKKAWRGIGIGRSLVPATITTVTHLTDVGRSIMQKHINIKFNPFFN